MRSFVAVAAAVAIGSVVFATSCSDSSPGTAPPPPKNPVYATCYTDDNCASGSCAVLIPTLGYGICSQSCSNGGDACPDGGACGVAADGTSHCFSSCAAIGSAPMEFVCVQGAPVACAHADPARCDICGCPSSQRCVPGTGCLPKNDVGGACTADSDCNTNNCSTLSGKCLTAVGQSCTGSNCDRCYSATGTSFSYCSRTCTTKADCNGGYCLGYTGMSSFCYPPCTSGCVGGCQYAGDGMGGIDFSTQYCDVTQDMVTYGASALGYPCGGSCAGGTCYSAGTNDVCTKPCAANADCGQGFACLSMPCTQADAGAANCPLCVATCSTEAGTCRSGTGTCTSEATADGSSASVCDPRITTGGTCYSNGTCLSGRCITGTCAPPGGLANGNSCSLNGDCISNNCAGGACKGTAVLGGACSGSADCAVGTCCTTGSLVNTCETSC
jgi:hypothetical protein